MPAVKAGAFLDPRQETRDMRLSARRRFLIGDYSQFLLRACALIHLRLFILKMEIEHAGK